MSVLALSTFLFVAAAVAAMVFTHRTRAWAHRVRMLDYPDGQRRRHGRATPRAGGVAVVLAYILTMSVWGAMRGLDAAAFRQGASVPLVVLVGGLLMFLLGVRDDVRHIRARFKLLAQALVAVSVCLVGAGIPPQALGLTGGTSMAAVGVGCLSILWIVGVTNSLNLLDGSDGVAAGTAAIAAITLMVAAMVLNQPVLAVSMAVLAGAAVGFLLFNFPPATIFLGDGGSLFLGFSLAMGAMGLVRAEPAARVLLAVTLAVAVPVADTVLVIYRRVAEGRPIFAPDRAHIHHRLLELGHTGRRVALLIYAAALLVGAASLALLATGPRTGLVLLAVTVVTGWWCIRYLAIPEALRLGALRSVKLHSRGVPAAAAAPADVTATGLVTTGDPGNREVRQSA